MGGRVGGWSEDWRVMLNSTQNQVKVEVEVRVELGKKSRTSNGQVMNKSFTSHEQVRNKTKV